MPTATQKKTAKKMVAFHSACPNLLLIRVPEDEIMLSQGAKRKVAGTSYEFVNQALFVREGQDMLEDGNDPETGEPVMQDAVTWLRGEAEKRNPSQPDWFEEEHPPVPDKSVALNEIVTVLAARDADALARILDDERESHNREEVVDAAMRAFQALDEQETPAA